MSNKIGHRWFSSTLTILTFSILMLAACGTLGVEVAFTPTPRDTTATRTAVSATEEANRETSAGTSGTPVRGATDHRPTPTSVLDGSHLSYSDPVLGFSLDIPLWWETHAMPGALAQFFQQDHTGARKNVLSISALNPESDTLEAALVEVTQGSWGPYIHDVQPVSLGAFEALRLELIPGAERPPVAWLMSTPSGRAVGITPGGDRALIKPMIEVVLGTLRPLEVAAPQATLTPEPPLEVTPLPRSISDLVEPLLIDGEQGWIFATARVDGQPRTVKLATQDGRLLAAYGIVGKLALDRTGGRLLIDQGEDGVAVLDAQSGAQLGTIPLPIAGPADVDPQIDPATGLAYVFRDSTIYVLDPAALTIKDTSVLSVPMSVCGDPGNDAPIARSFYDLVSDKLYLAFVTYVCTPWVHQTIVAYDAGTLNELGRYQTELRYRAVPFLDSLYGTTAGRLGRNVSWAWNGREVWFEEGQAGVPVRGIVADWGRQLVYEALGKEIRVLRAYPREWIGQVEMPLLAGNGQLVGHDPISDQLYFLVDGQLEIRPTQTILTSLAERVGATPTPTPYLGPTFTPLPTVTPQADLACLQEWEQLSAEFSRAWQRTSADLNIEGLAGSDASVMGECTVPGNGQASTFVPTQTWFQVGVSVRGPDYDQVGDSLAQYLDVLFARFSESDLPGSDGIIYGTLSTSYTDVGGWPNEWVHYLWLSFAEAKAAHSQGLKGRALLDALEIITPSQ